MEPSIQEDNSGQSSRQISSDDAIMVSNLYPVATFAASTGSITGTITDSQGASVKGAHVVALRAQGGATVGSQLSGNGGVYRIDGLPPGNYNMMVEPLDGPFTLANMGSFYSNGGRSDFTTTMFGGLNSPAVVTVNAGQSASANVQLPPDPAGVAHS